MSLGAEARPVHPIRDEIGLTSVAIAPELAQDPWEANEPGLGLGRDPSRTPFQWDDSINAGFSNSTPWLPLASDHRDCNAKCLQQDRKSILSLYRRLIQIRKQHLALRVGDARVIGSENNVLSFERSGKGEKLIIVLNFGPEARSLPDFIPASANVMLSTCMDFDGPIDASSLRGNEGLIFHVNS